MDHVRHCPPCRVWFSTALLPPPAPPSDSSLWQLPCRDFLDSVPPLSPDGWESAAPFCSFAAWRAASCLTLAATRLAFPSAAAILILRFSNTLFQPLLTEIQNRQIRTDNRATALSVNSMLLNSVAIGTNLVFGALADRDSVRRLPVWHRHLYHQLSDLLPSFCSRPETCIE